jgi:processive 1,2-diacylglycerol beta-glucosyltransferase
MGYKIAILFASVGTDHESAAMALKEWCETEYRSSEVICKDVLDYVPHWIRWSVKTSYLAMARRYPWLWSRFYRSSDVLSHRELFAAFWNDIHRSVARTYVKYMIRDIDEFAPDAVLTTHFFGMPVLLEKWDRGAPIYFVGVDYLSHKLQRDPRFDGWFVGSSESARQHRADNVPTAELTVRNFGIPVSRRYISPPDRSEARKRLGVEADAVMILIAGGGVGAGALGDVADSMLERTDWRIDVICGTNDRMRDSLRDKYYPFKHINVHGFVDDMQYYYAASDIVALRPSGVSCAEALAARSVILLIDPLPGQEQYNCDYLLEKGAARMVFENRKAGELIAELLESDDEVGRIRLCADKIMKPLAAKDILSFVTGKIEERRAAANPDTF